MLARVFKSPAYVDDRGRPVDLSGSREVAKDLWRDDHPRAFWARKEFGWVLGGLAWLWLAFNVTSLTVGNIIYMMVLLLVPFCLQLSARLENDPQQLPPEAATLAACGRCGSCGYTLAEVTPDGDGCAACPECGASWHRDRVIFPSVGPGFTRERLFPRRPYSLSIARKLDSRGVVLNAGISRDRTTGDLAVAARFPELFAMLTGFAGRRFFLGCLAIAGFWFLAVLTWPLWHEPDPFAFASFCVVTAVIGLVLVFARWRRDLPVAMLRREMARAGLCPECHSDLPEGPAQFDGCVQCPKCRYAWRRGAGGEA